MWLFCYNRPNGYRCAGRGVKVHHVLDNLQIGGAETLVVGLARVQRAEGFDVQVHGMYRGGPLEQNLRRESIPVHTHDSMRLPAIVAKLLRSFRREKPDVVHCHNITATVAGAVAAKLAGVPVAIATRHGLSHVAARERRFWLAAKLCDKVVTVAEAARREIASNAWADAAKTVLVYNGAAPPNADPEGETVQPKTAAFRFISVGRLNWAKDFPSLLRAFALALRQVPDMELWIAGDGEERPAVEKTIAELELAARVRLLGMRRNVGFWYSQCDAFVLASVSEGLPVTLLEAMCEGLPAVVTDVGGMPEVIRMSEAGVVVPPGNPEVLGSAMAEMASRRGELEPLRLAARRCYDERFSMERMAAEYAALYRSCLG